LRERMITLKKKLSVLGETVEKAMNPLRRTLSLILLIEKVRVRDSMIIRSRICLKIRENNGPLMKSLSSLCWKKRNRRTLRSKILTWLKNRKKHQKTKLTIFRINFEKT
jgi:hypothetical protein